MGDEEVKVDSAERFFRTLGLFKQEFQFAGGTFMNEDT